MSGFDPVPRVSTTQYVQRQMIEAIRNGTFASGATLPSEKELGDTFGVSRVTIREALAGLVATGLVEIRQGKRAEVRRGAADEYLGLFSLYMDHHRSELKELLDVRGCLDGLAAHKATVAANPDKLRAIRHTERDFADAVEADSEVAELKKLDVRFHGAIAEAAGSALLARMLSDLQDQFEHSREILFLDESALATSVSEHAAIRAAIDEGQSARARSLATAHVQTLLEWFAKVQLFDPTSPS